MANESPTIVYEPRVIKIGPNAGLWHFVEFKNGKARPIGDCAFHVGHATPEEAVDCFKKYFALNAAFYAEFANGTPQPCVAQGCSRKTTAFAKAGYFGYQVNLCDEHRNAEGLKSALSNVPKRDDPSLTVLSAG